MAAETAKSSVEKSCFVLSAAVPVEQIRAKPRFLRHFVTMGSLAAHANLGCRRLVASLGRMECHAAEKHGMLRVVVLDVIERL